MTINSELPERVRHHLKNITASSGLPQTEESLARITENWLEKKAMFEGQTRLLDMETVERFPASDNRGVIILTYSGSLVIIGPRQESGRWFEYASIKLRANVPELVREQGMELDGDLLTGSVAAFSRCSIKHSSDILLLAVCPAGLSRAEEEHRLREAAVFLTNGFVKLNRTLTIPEDSIGHFTAKNIVSYVADKHGLTQVKAREILDDYLSTLEVGVLLGERVPLGPFGWLKLAVRPARKARIGRNPATGEELVIAAKPDTVIPKIVFSTLIKDRAAQVPVDRVVGPAEDDED